MLTNRQKMFAREYLTDLNATQAAIRAGYSEKTATKQGSQLLKNPAINEFIAEYLAERCDVLDITVESVLQDLCVVIERSMQPIPITDKEGNLMLLDNGKGELVPAATFDADNALKGLELLGRYLQMFNSSREHLEYAVKPMGGVPQKVDDEQAARIYAELINC